MEQTATDTKSCPATITCRKINLIEIAFELLPEHTKEWLEERTVQSVDIDHTGYGEIISHEILNKWCDRVSDIVIKYILKTYSDADYYYFKYNDL